MTRATPIEELRQRPCVHGHSRLDAYVYLVGYKPRLGLKCRQCLRESNKRRKQAERASRAWRTWERRQ